MGEQQKPFPEKERFLSVLCNHDGTMGRTCVHSVQWRWLHGSRTWQKRAAPIQILYYGWRYTDPFLRGWCFRYSTGENCSKRKIASWQDASGWYQKRKSHWWRRTERDLRKQTAIWWMAGQQSDRVKRSEDPESESSFLYGRRMQKTSESIWIFLWRSKDIHPEYGEEWCGRNGCYGYRCTACGIIRYASESVRIFQTAFCTGNQPSDRCHPWEGRYIHNGLYWRRW